MTFNQLTSRDVTSLSVTRKEVETRQKLYFTVLSRQIGCDNYSGMKEKGFCDDVFDEVHVNINFECFTMQVMLLGRKCYPLDYF